MNTMNKLIKTSCGLLILFFAGLCSAKNINIYDQPAANAKPVGLVDSEYGIITIFTPKGSEWTKVADPRNGNVGWMKKSELGTSSFKLNIITKESGNHRYQIYQYGNMSTPSPAQIENQIRSMQYRQQAIQRDMQHMMNDMFGMLSYPTPIILPVVITPQQPSSKPSKPITSKIVQSSQKSASSVKIDARNSQ